MKIAYLIDRETIGGGCEYVRRKIDERRRTNDECRTFCSERGECTPAAMDAWGAEEVVVNHLKALVQLLGNPLRRPKGRVTFVVHGIHLRKYDWMLRECPGAVGRIALRMKRAARRRMEAWLYHRCDRVVALTETDRADVLRLYGDDLEVAVEPNTLDGWEPRTADALPAELAESCKTDRTCFTKYVCIGRFDYQKGQDRWIRRMRDEESGIGNGKTLFIGDGPALGACKALARRLGVDDRCVFAGAIPDADRYLKCADIVVSPSRWEGMPYLMMKARAVGCRILATDCQGNRDVLEGYDRWERLELG